VVVEVGESSIFDILGSKVRLDTVKENILLLYVS